MLHIEQFAWQRYFAKMIDLALGSILLMLMVIICGPFFIPIETLEKLQHIDKNIDRIITMFFTCILVIPLMHNLFGTTLGKKIWGINVYNSRGECLDFKGSLNREIQVFFKGLLFFPISGFYQYWALTRKHTTSWDQELHLVVSCQRHSFLSFVIRLVISIVSFILVAILNVTLDSI